MNVLVVNAGSSSLKLTVLDDGYDIVAASTHDVRNGEIDQGAVEDVVKRAGNIAAVGHRVVHGGVRYTTSVVVDEQVVAGLRELTSLAPLHQPAALAALEIARQVLPGVCHVACFDTAFHAGMPAAAATYALPIEWRQGLGVRRFGFHGLSHAYAARRAADMLGTSQQGLAVVSCHLGAGASLAAVVNGTSIDTTMGFTPLEGLVMATRSGSVDPGLLLWLLSEKGLTVSEISDALEQRSGLRALAGSADMREVVVRRAAGDVDAAAAVDVYVHRLCFHIGAMAASLGRIDALVFTGGVGERAPAIRAAAAGRLGFLGVEIDDPINERATGDVELSAPHARVRTLVVHAREDLEIARETRQVLRA
jgi:acetate kinase